MLFRISVFVFLLFAILFTHSLYAQQLGGNRPSIKWKQINIAPAKIIFPVGLDSQAAAVAAQINLIAASKSYSLGDRLKQVPIVLQNQPVLSNGYVALGPFRSEFFMTPPADNLRLGSLPWERQLAVHEYRHVHQYLNFKKGPAAIGAVVFGQQAQALMNALTIPDWFFEGDAVFSETMYTAQGRGRVPYFLNEFKALKSIVKKPNYMQMRNGSLRYQYPNHYQLGYLMVAHGYDVYGQGFWNNVTEQANNIRGVFYPFQKAVRRNTGKSYQAFTADALKEYFQKASDNVSLHVSSMEDVDANNHAPSKSQPILDNTKRDKFVESYLNPQAVNEDSVIWLKRSTKAIAAFYLKTATGETKIGNRYIGNDDYFSYRHNQILYTSATVHPRWGWQEYNDLLSYNIQTRKTHRLSRKKRYFSPSMNRSGTQIVVVESTPFGESKLQLLDASTGGIQKTIQFPQDIPSVIGGKGVFTFPTYYGDSAIVAALRFANGQMAVALFSLHQEATRLLTPLSYQVYTAPRIKDDAVYLNASLDGSDKIIRIQLKEGNEIAQLQQSEMEYNPIQVANKLWASKFTINGFKPVQLEAKTADWIPVIATSWDQLPTAYDILNKTPYTDVSQPMAAPAFATQRFPVTDYRASTKLFNFHSWQPTIDDPYWGLTLYGQNVLNTFLSEFSYKYNTNEGSHTASAAIIYAALFPYLRANIDYTKHRTATINQQQIHWDELTASLGYEIPLQFNSGHYYRSFSIRNSFNNQSLFISNKNKGSFTNSNFNFIRAGFTYSAQLPKASQQIYPRFAHYLRVDWRKSITEYNVQQFNAAANLYLPGLFPTHSLVFNGAFHQRDNNQRYRFSNDFSAARGYTDYNFQRIYKVGTNYHLPLCYPEFGIANILYFLRVRANLFLDVAKVTDNFIINNQLKQLSFDQNSTGIEIYFDTRWWNQLPVSFGVRYSRLLNNDIFGRNVNQFEFIMPIDLF